MPGLGTSYGRGGATSFPPDLKNSDSILVMGSNMAECHPVAFRWVMQAKTRWPNPATITNIDNAFRFTNQLIATDAWNQIDFSGTSTANAYTLLSSMEDECTGAVNFVISAIDRRRR